MFSLDIILGPDREMSVPDVTAFQELLDRRIALLEGWKSDVVSSSSSDVGGFKEVIISVSGKAGCGKSRRAKGTGRQR